MGVKENTSDCLSLSLLLASNYFSFVNFCIDIFAWPPLETFGGIIFTLLLPNYLISNPEGK